MTRSKTRPLSCPPSHIATIPNSAFRRIKDQHLLWERPSATRNLLVRDAGFQTENGTRWGFFSGLWPRIANLLQDAGVRAEAEIPLAWEYAHRQKRFLWRALEGRIHSLLLLRRASDQASLIAGIVRRQPKEHILLVARNNNDARKLGERLREQCGLTVSWAPHDRFGHPWRHICSVGSLQGSVCTNHWDIIYFTDAELVVARTGWEFLNYAEQAIRIAAISRELVELPEDKHLIVEMFFGNVMYPPLDHTWRNPVVTWLPFAEARQSKGTLVERLRRDIWQNCSRNRLIAQAANALAAGSAGKLEDLGLAAAARHLELPTKRPSVAIIVENLEQREQLRRRLPRWQIASDREIVDGRAIEHHTIATAAAARGTPVSADVLLFAAGGPVPCLIDTGRGLLTIDVDDRNDATEARKRAYVESGWCTLPGGKKAPMT